MSDGRPFPNQPFHRVLPLSGVILSHWRVRAPPVPVELAAWARLIGYLSIPAAHAVPRRIRSAVPGTFSAFTSWPIVVLNTRARLY